MAVAFSIYVTMFFEIFVNSLLTGLYLIYGISFYQVPFCENTTTIVPNPYTIDCQWAVGYLAVYRLCFALAAFFFLMALIMIGVKSSRDSRAGLQNGYVILYNRIQVVFKQNNHKFTDETT